MRSGVEGSGRLVDVAPTVLKLLGLAVPEEFDGVVLGGLADGEKGRHGFVPEAPL
jgi:hypothetical protein